MHFCYNIFSTWSGHFFHTFRPLYNNKINALRNAMVHWKHYLFCTSCNLNDMYMPFYCLNVLRNKKHFRTWHANQTCKIYEKRENMHFELHCVEMHLHLHPDVMVGERRERPYSTFYMFTQPFKKLETQSKNAFVNCTTLVRDRDIHWDLAFCNSSAYEHMY
jgi:hypothetical protein